MNSSTLILENMLNCFLFLDNGWDSFLIVSDSLTISRQNVQFFETDIPQLIIFSLLLKYVLITSVP